MGIFINENKCIHCGECVDICPEDILFMEQGNVFVKYPLECCWCDSCEIDCPAGAITVRFTKEAGPIFMKRGTAIR